MRTTLTIDDDVLAAARSLAESERKSVGQVLSELARSGLAPRVELADEAGVPVFRVSPNAAPLTPERVRRAADED